MSNLKTAINSKIAEVNKKTKEIEQLKSETTEQHGMYVQKELKDLTKIMEEKTEEIQEKYASSDSFYHLFWHHQLEALKVKDKRQIRWHSMMIHWCLSLKLISSAS